MYQRTIAQTLLEATMPRTVFGLDFDYTLYDTKHLEDSMQEYLQDMGFSVEDILTTLEIAKKRTYSFDHHLDLLKVPGHLRPAIVDWFNGQIERGDMRLYPDTVECVRELSLLGSCRIVTFGNEDYQRAKIYPCKELIKYIDELYVASPMRSKGEIIAEHSSRAHHTWHLDDTIAQLEDVALKSPRTRCVRMLRNPSLAPSSDDTRWTTVSNLREFVELVKGSQ